MANATGGKLSETLLHTVSTLLYLTEGAAYYCTRCTLYVHLFVEVE